MTPTSSVLPKKFCTPCWQLQHDLTQEFYYCYDVPNFEVVVEGVIETGQQQ